MHTHIGSVTTGRCGRIGGIVTDPRSRVVPTGVGIAVPWRVRSERP